MPFRLAPFWVDGAQNSQRDDRKDSRSSTITQTTSHPYSREADLNLALGIIWVGVMIRRETETEPFSAGLRRDRPHKHSSATEALSTIDGTDETDGGHDNDT
jgi:hypothetical protein